MNLKSSKIIALFSVAIALTLGLSICFQSLLAAWTAPLANPATCLTGNPGCDAPISSGSPLVQQMQGALWIVDSSYPASPNGLIVEKGNVGIGTINPDYKLIVSGTGVQRMGVTATDNNAAGAGIFLRTMNGASQVSNATIRTDNVGNLGFFTGTTGEALQMIIKSNGNVGIGTIAPAQKLHVISASGASVASFDRTSDVDSNVRDFIDFNRGSAGRVGGLKTSNTAVQLWGKTELQLGINEAAKATINSAGNLYVTGTAYANGQALCQANGTNCPASSGLKLDTWQGSHYSGSDGAEYATTFYDANNGGYYVDPNGTTNMNAITGATRSRWGLSDNWTNRASITGDTNYWTGSQGWGANNLNTEAPEWGSTFFDVWSNPVGQPSGTSHWQGVQAFHMWNGSTGYGSQLVFGSPMMNGALFMRSIWGGGWSGWNRFYNDNYHPNADALGGYGVGAFCRQDGSNCPASSGLKLDTWQGSHYSGSDGAEYATIFYDTNNGGYYVDPNATSKLNQAYINDLRVDILYDKQNTGYYVDPNATTKVNALNVNSITLGGITIDSWPVASMSVGKDCNGSECFADDKTSNEVCSIKGYSYFLGMKKQCICPDRYIYRWDNKWIGLFANCPTSCGLYVITNITCAK